MEEVNSFRPNPELYKTISLIATRENPYAESKVFAAKYLPSADVVAMKKYNVENLCCTYIADIQNELILMGRLKNPCIAAVLMSFVCEYDVVLVMPLAECGSCKDLIERKFITGIPEHFIATIIKDTIRALVFLHENRIVHRAVRASHILTNEYGAAKLTGFRYAIERKEKVTKLHDFPHDSAPNLLWLSPELLEQNSHGYTEKSDVYSLGITICELANGSAPFQYIKPKQMLIEKLSSIIPPLVDSTTFTEWHAGRGNCTELTEDQINVYSNRTFCENFHSLKDACCNKIPEERPNSAGLLEHPFFTETGKRSKRAEEGCCLLPAIFPLKSDSQLTQLNDCKNKINSEDLNVVWDF